MTAPRSAARAGARQLAPYFDNGQCVIYHGRAEDVLPRLPRDSVDLLLTDPPYGVNWQSGLRRGPRFDLIVGDDGSLNVSNILKMALQALRRGRHVYIFGRLDLSDLPLCSQVELVWDKGLIGPGDLSISWGLSHETITFAVYEISKKNRENGSGRLTARMRQGSVIRCQRLHSGQVERHPTEKPVLLLRQLLESSSVIGETVLDPFMGSGSTLVAAQIEGRHGIGIEVEERYCAIAAGRLAQLPLIGAVS